MRDQQAVERRELTLLGQADGFHEPRQVATIAPDGSEELIPEPEGTHARLRPTS